MAGPGETITLGASPTCETCGCTPTFQPCKSNAGWYVGTYCACGPYSRESTYYRTKEEVARRIVDDTWERR